MGLLAPAQRGGPAAPPACRRYWLARRCWLARRRRPSLPKLQACRCAAGRRACHTRAPLRRCLLPGRLRALWRSSRTEPHCACTRARLPTCSCPWAHLRAPREVAVVETQGAELGVAAAHAHAAHAHVGRQLGHRGLAAQLIPRQAGGRVAGGSASRQAHAQVREAGRRSRRRRQQRLRPVCRCSILLPWQLTAPASPSMPSGPSPPPPPPPPSRMLTSASCATASACRRSPGACGASHGRYLPRRARSVSSRSERQAAAQGAALARVKGLSVAPRHRPGAAGWRRPPAAQSSPGRGQQGPRSHAALPPLPSRAARCSCALPAARGWHHAWGAPPGAQDAPEPVCRQCTSC